MQDKDGNDQEYLQFDGSDTTKITINSWAYKTGQYYGLSSFIYANYFYPICPDCELAPTILPALLNTSQFLYSFQPDGMVVYEPDKIEVRVDVRGSTDDEPAWPLGYPRLAELYDPDNQEPAIFTGEIAKQIYDLVFGIGGERGSYYSEDGVAYSVYAHPVYPYPWNTEEKYPGIPDTLTCYPTDGVFETP